MINLNNITKAYGGAVILNNFSLSMAKDSKFCIMGRSGVGKTTIINILLGLEKPDSGTIEIKKDLKMSCVFQENRLIESLSAEKNILLVAKGKNIAAAAEGIGLSSQDLQKPVSLLSGGQKRRIAILRAVLCDSDIVIFDEAMQGFDDATETAVVDFVVKNINERALLAITHSKTEAQRYGAEIIELDDIQ